MGLWDLHSERTLMCSTHLSHDSQYRVRNINVCLLCKFWIQMMWPSTIMCASNITWGCAAWMTASSLAAPIPCGPTCLMNTTWKCVLVSTKPSSPPKKLRAKEIAMRSLHHLISSITSITEAWWCHGNTFASHATAWVRLWVQAACGMSFTLHSQCLVGFPLGAFFHPQKGSKLFCLELSHKANWPAQNLFWVT